jgi:hypothetical protein
MHNIITRCLINCIHYKIIIEKSNLRRVNWACRTLARNAYRTAARQSERRRPFGRIHTWEEV